MMLDVFKTDAFHFTKLVGAVTRLPFQPTLLGSMGMFSERGISTLTCAYEMQNGVLTLVPSAARGSRGPAKNPERRKLVDFRTTHLPQSATVAADEVIGLRAYGSETDEVVAMQLLMQKLGICRRDLDLTHEYQRMGAIKGQVLDADGVTVLYDFFTAFDVTQQTHAMILGTDTTRVRTKVIEAKRKAEDKLGGTMNAGWMALCSSEFFDKMADHPLVKEDLHWVRPGDNIRDLRSGGFEFADVLWKEYRGQVGSTRFIDANEAFLIPMGVPGLFETVFSPADDIRVAGTMGVPFHVSDEFLPHGAGIDYKVQSNPLHACTRPEAIINLTTN
jgi:hypothetical protein